MEFEKMYTAEDVAEITGLTLRTIRNYIKSGKLTGRRIGVQWRFTAADIQALFDMPTQTAEAEEAVTEESREEDAPSIQGEDAPASEELADGITSEEELQTARLTGVEPEMAEQITEFLKRKKTPRASACCVVDMPGMSEQEAAFLMNRLQTLAAVYEDTPRRVEITYTYDIYREQARFTFTGALDTASAMMNLCNVQ
jgi:excisionase family DNA binding protein